MGSAVELVNSRRNQYGPRQTDEFVGGEIAGGAWEKELVVRVRGYALNDNTTVVALSNEELAGLRLLKGTIVKAITWRNKVTFAPAGTTPTIILTDVGGVNVVASITGADLTTGANHVVEVTPAAPYDAPLAVDEPLEIRVANVDNAFASDGQGEFVVHYYDVRG